MMSTTRPFLLLLLLLLTAPVTLAQQPSSNNGNDSGFYGQTTFNPTVAVLIVVLVSAFFFLGFFSIFLRQCQGDGDNGAARSLRGGIAGVMGRSRRQRGLDRAVLDTFPTLVYSEVKEHKIGKGVLECAVCLSEFEDEETLRLLPKCSHVFHPDCIDAWLESHVTCPVCRSNLVPDPDAPSPPAADLGSAAAAAAGNRGGEAVAIDVDSNERGEEGGREIRLREEAVELDRIGSQRRATRTSRFPRSHSTGHSLAVQREEGLDRFTLRLPDHIRKEIIAAGKLKRSRSLLAFPTGGEGSSRRGYRGGGGGGGEGSSRGGRSIRLGPSDRWNSFLARTFSARFPPWATGRRGEGGDGSVKKGDGEGSTKGKLGSVKGSFDCLGGGGGAVDDESPAERV